MKSINTHSQTGAVSIFVVIFAMLLLTVVTTSFLRLMVSDQQRAINTDLSQSAYDSAQAGVEDAKRALIWYQERCAANPSECGEGGDITEALSSTNCNTGLRYAGVVSGLSDDTSEVLVQQSTSADVDATLNQAYTCTTMQLITNDVVGSIPVGGSKILALRGVDAFTQVRVSWFSPENLESPSETVVLPTEASQSILPSNDSWLRNRPPVLRTQLMQVGPEFTLANFDATSGEGADKQSNTNTLFLYPVRASGGNTTASFTGRDNRKTTTDVNTYPTADSPNNSPLPTLCQPDISAGQYSCSITLTLPNPIGAGDRTAFLRLSAFYNETNFRVQLMGTRFNAVQPIVDSTGRANDVFRRVESRVELYDSDFPYPDAAVDVSGDFCKDFSVTDTRFIPEGACTYE
jgi:Tfp pilus assembly protein PilX